jgi:hypothetical protein
MTASDRSEDLWSNIFKEAKAHKGCSAKEEEEEEEEIMKNSKIYNRHLVLLG